MNDKIRIRSYQLVVMGFLLILTNSCKKGDETPSSIIDKDGNVYKTVTIGTQVWMAENLKTTKYNDGTGIPLVTDGRAWAALSTPGCCWYNNDAPTYKDTYGCLYNWYTVNTGKLCPAGWHVPNDTEWTPLITYLDGESFPSCKLKEIGTTHWLSPNAGSTNESGFTALPGGCRYDSGIFDGAGGNGFWWTSTGGDTGYAWLLYMYSNNFNVYRSALKTTYGYSVRCVMD